ncbi:hypothetical protein [Streptomyces gobitricini]|uniref:Integral membrane protein n=1 Tax=Streptomyces gobitricini TaxID=68211 RepID=A0ABN3LN36_9ACTN
MQDDTLNQPGRRLSVGWAVTLSFDVGITCLASLILCGIGLLLPGITEDYGESSEPSSPAALVWFAGALLLLGSLAATTPRVRSAKDGPRRLGCTLSALRLGLLILGAVGYVVYGIVTIELA